MTDSIRTDARILALLAIGIIEPMRVAYFDAVTVPLAPLPPTPKARASHEWHWPSYSRVARQGRARALIQLAHPLATYHNFRASMTHD